MYILLSLSLNFTCYTASNLCPIDLSGNIFSLNIVVKILYFSTSLSTLLKSEKMCKLQSLVCLNLIYYRVFCNIIVISVGWEEDA